LPWFKGKNEKPGGEKEFGGWEEKNSLTDELLRLPDYC
jgi:hypothetical protein